jgi:hypothetical protein
MSEPRSPTKPQLDKFKEAARELQTDDDATRFDERLKRVVIQKVENLKAPEKPKKR